MRGATSSFPSCTRACLDAERRERAIAALGLVGLSDRVDHKPGELSGGQQQRVAVARALVTEPDLILADEPTGNLDSVSTADVLGLFEELNRQGRTIVLITHEQEVAAQTERALVIRDGEIVQTLTRDELRYAAGRADAAASAAGRLAASLPGGAR